ncbi:hypothetical protein [Brevibacterium sp. W7.2]|uniref:hypothetical protein n=1 Tax=Brevibacterium sp. W7.2 TaxID=2823518 RepID=UPI001BA7E057|nr:hypothetical protein [Brevibacterium sp. W7.2]
MDEYRFMPGSDFLGHFRLEPPIAGAELIGVTLGVDSRALCTWLAGTDDGFDAPPADVAAGHLRPAASPVTVTLQDKEAGVVQVWDIPNPMEGASYRVLPEGHLFACAYYLTIIEESFRRRAIVYDRNSAIVTMGSLRVEADDVRTTGDGAIWVANKAIIFEDFWIPVPGLERFSADLKLQWEPNEGLRFSPGPMSVLGDGVVFFDHEHGAPYLSADESWLADQPDASGWVLHDPETQRWGFVELEAAGQLYVTLGWMAFHGRWKPFSKGSIPVPFASPMESTHVECDASSVHVWIGQRWYSLTLSDLFDDSIKSVAPRLPDVAPEEEEPAQ